MPKEGFESDFDEAAKAGFADANPEEDFGDMFDDDGGYKSGAGSEQAESEYFDPYEEGLDEQHVNIRGAKPPKAAAQDDLQAPEGGFADGEDDAAYEETGDFDDESDADSESESEEYWSPELLSAAGIDEATAHEYYDSPSELAQAVRDSDAQMIRQAQSQQAVHQEEAEEQAEQDSLGSDNFDDAIPEEWDDASKDFFRKQNAIYQAALAKRDKEILSQREAIQNAKQQELVRKQIEYNQNFEKFVDNLGDEWKGTFGKGTVPPESMAFRNRQMLDQTASQLAQTLHVAGTQIPDQDVLRLRALYAMYPDRQRAVAKREVTEQIEKRQKMMTTPPTSRRRPGRKGEDRAVARAERRFQEAGLYGFEDIDTI